MKNRTYRYMEKEALYPFGYGLTYSDTCVTEAEVVGEVSAESDITVSYTHLDVYKRQLLKRR